MWRMDSLVVTGRLSGLGAWASMWDLLGPGIEPMSPELADGFFTTEPPGKPQEILSYSFFVDCLETQLL